MRDILFRGKRVHNGDWMYGTFSMTINKTILIDDGANFLWAVDPATVGQYTGLKDKNGTKIFEGDIVKCENYHGTVRGTVTFAQGAYYLACSSGYSDEYLFNCTDIEVVGNIHDGKTEDKQ